MDAMISRPRYDRLSLGLGRTHLLIIQGSELPLGCLASSVTLDDFDEIWKVVSCSSVLPEPGSAEKQFRSANHLTIALCHRLSSETMGLRVYVVGEESFVWDINAQCRRFGLGNDEIHVFAPYHGARRVRCAHCRAYTTNCQNTIVTCDGCGATLLVRDHFSRFWNAYQGFQIDSEEPGVVPESVAFRS